MISHLQGASSQNSSVIGQTETPAASVTTGVQVEAESRHAGILKGVFKYDPAAPYYIFPNIPADDHIRATNKLF